MITAIALPMEVTAAVAELEASTLDKVEALANLIGASTIAYLQSYTDEMRPPIHKGDPQRLAHPGHWGDVTTNLKKGYRYAVERVGGQVQLTLANDVEYAATLEQREGFWVLTGVADPGGPVEQAILQAAGEVGLEVQVEFS